MSHITSTSWVAMDTAAEKIQVAIFRGSEATPSEEFEVSANSRELYVCEFGRSGDNYMVRVKDTMNSDDELIRHLMN